MHRIGLPMMLAGVAAACVACGEAVAPQGIVLVTLDTTRADHLGCYGHEGAETPNLDALAADGALFLEAQAPVPVTLPAHATIFTGQPPTVHGIRYNGMFRLEEASVTVAEILGDAGWYTMGVPASFPLTAATGIGQGFAVYDDLFEKIDPEELSPDADRSAEEISRIGVDLLEDVGDRRFFLWLHYWDPHYPYEAPFPFSARFRERPYDGEIAYVDREIGKLFEALRGEGLWDRCLVIVAGDHGEGLYEHGEKMHANLVYQSTLRVPLIVKPPGASRPVVVEEPVGLADLAATMLDFAGIEPPSEMEGVSLRPAIRGDALEGRDLYFESLAGSLAYGWSPLEGLRRGRWKYIRSPSPELFDLETDPEELENLHDAEDRRAAEMEAALAELESGWRENEPTAAAAGAPVDPASLEMLASLGYIGGSMSPERRGGPAPVEMIHLELDIFHARDEMLVGEYAAALGRLERLLEADPTNRYALWMAARAARGLGDTERAREIAMRAMEIYPELVPARILLGELHIVENDMVGALEVFRAGLEYDPDDPGLSYRTAVALYALDRLEEAEEIADRMIGGAVEEASSFLVLRAACRATKGDDPGALESLGHAIDAGYRDRATLEEEPLLEPLRGVPGFEEVVGRMKEES